MKQNKDKEFIKDPICPYCKHNQKDKHPFKTWNYGPNIIVNRYECKCKKKFNYYKGPQMTWTLPRLNKRTPDNN